MFRDPKINAKPGREIPRQIPPGSESSALLRLGIILPSCKLYMHGLKHTDDMGGSRDRRRSPALLPLFMLSALSALTLIYTIPRLQEPHIGVTIIFKPFQPLITNTGVDVEGLEVESPVAPVLSPPRLPACTLDQPAIDIVLPDGSLHAILWLTWLNVTVDCSGARADGH